MGVNSASVVKRRRLSYRWMAVKRLLLWPLNRAFLRSTIQETSERLSRVEASLDSLLHSALVDPSLRLGAGGVSELDGIVAHAAPSSLIDLVLTQYDRASDQATRANLDLIRSIKDLTETFDRQAVSQTNQLEQALATQAILREELAEVKALTEHVRAMSEQALESGRGGPGGRIPDAQAMDGMLEGLAGRISNEARSLEAQSFRQGQALDALERLMGQKGFLPYTRGWAASPDVLLLLFAAVRARRPKVVVEFGSGVSSIVIGTALQMNGEGHLYSLDHLDHYAARTRGRVETEGLSHFVTVLECPLRPWRPKSPSALGSDWDWYGCDGMFSDLPPIDFVFVDGPPSAVGSFSRYPAVPELIGFLAERAVIVVDDIVRDEDAEVVNSWRDGHGLVSRLDRGYEKGLAVLGRRLADVESVLRLDADWLGGEENDSFAVDES